MFDILAMLDRTEFENVRHIIRSKQGYDFDTLSHSNSVIIYTSPLVNMYIRTTSENQPVGVPFHGLRGDLVFVNEEIVSDELLKSTFIPCCKEGIAGIRKSWQLVDQMSKSTVINVLVIAEEEHFNSLQEKLRAKCYNTQNKLFVSRYDLVFYGNFIEIRVIRRRYDHCESLRGRSADIIFVEREDLYDPNARYRIYRACKTGMYGVHDINDLLDRRWCN